MKFLKTKTILTKVKYGDSWYGVDYNMNLYRGCSHGCIYCDSRSNCYHIENFDSVNGKKNALSTLRSELLKKNVGVVGMGSMSDRYNPMEKKHQITRGALELILRNNYGVAIDTKSDLILRDTNLLKEINKNNNVIVKFTITTHYDKLASITEPNVSLPSSRLKAIKTLSDNGIFVGIMLNPVLPYITDKEEDIKRLVFLAHQNGTKFIHTYMGMTLKDKQRKYYYETLEKHFPGLKKRYESTYGEGYNCLVPGYKRLYKVFKETCDKYGILYDMEKIIKAYKKEVRKNEQIKFFEM